MATFAAFWRHGSNTVLLLAADYEPVFALAAIFVLAIFEIFFVGALAVFDQAALAALGFWKILAGNVLARFVSRSVLITGVNLNLSYARLLSMGVRWMILVLTGAMVLDHLALGGAIVEPLADPVRAGRRPRQRAAVHPPAGRGHAGLRRFARPA